MLEVEQARSRILEALPVLPEEDLPLQLAQGRIAARAVRAPLDLPPFDNSAMDGYAVLATDLVEASPERPVTLHLAGHTPAGASSEAAVQPGACVRVFTGAPMPRGADAVLMQEDTLVDSAQPTTIRCRDSVKPWENVRLRGEDIREGAPVLECGDRLRTGAIALLAALGIPEITVHRQPTIALIATGDELIEPGTPLQAGHIYESNRVMLLPLVREAGGIASVYPIARDTMESTRDALEAAFAECDAVITMGGVSVGEYDLVKAAFENLGGSMEFWRVAMKPGKPFVFGHWKNKILFGLPGNPVSAFATFLLLVRPALLRWQGAREIDLPRHPGELAEDIANRGDRRHFMRVQVDAEGTVRLAGAQASHMLSGLAKANGFVDVPPATTWKCGSVVTVLRFTF